MTRLTAPGSQRPRSARVVEVDVREDLRSGREPFARIMRAVQEIGGGEVLRVRAIFEPVPLFNALGKRGFSHQSEEHGPDDWSAWFWRAEAEPIAAPESPEPGAAPGGDRGTYLDVRGFSPPEPLVRTLIALETLPRGDVLVQVNNRVPHFLFPALAERGFTWQVDESLPDRVLVRIWHTA